MIRKKILLGCAICFLGTPLFAMQSSSMQMIAPIIVDSQSVLKNLYEAINESRGNDEGSATTVLMHGPMDADKGLAAEAITHLTSDRSVVLHRQLDGTKFKKVFKDQTSPVLKEMADNPNLRAAIIIYNIDRLLDSAKQGQGVRKYIQRIPDRLALISSLADSMKKNKNFLLIGTMTGSEIPGQLKFFQQQIEISRLSRKACYDLLNAFLNDLCRGHSVNRTALNQNFIHKIAVEMEGHSADNISKIVQTAYRKALEDRTDSSEPVVFLRNHFLRALNIELEPLPDTRTWWQRNSWTVIGTLKYGSIVTACVIGGFLLHRCIDRKPLWPLWTRTVSASSDASIPMISPSDPVQPGNAKSPSSLGETSKSKEENSVGLKIWGWKIWTINWSRKKS